MANPFSTLVPTIGMDTEVTPSQGTRKFWYLRAQVGDKFDYVSYELRVRHHHPEDTYTFLAANVAAETEEVMLPDAYQARLEDIAMNEPTDCTACAGLSDAAREALVEATGPNEDDLGWYCKDCHAVSLAQATAMLESRDTPVRAATETEVALYTALVNYWEAFARVFHPAVTL